MALPDDPVPTAPADPSQVTGSGGAPRLQAQLKLRALPEGWAEEVGVLRNLAAAGMGVEPLAGELEAIAQQLGDGAGASHPGPEAGIVVAAASHIPDQGHYVSG